MSMPPAKTFGRRGLAQAPRGAAPARPNTRPAENLAPTLPREIVAAIMSGPDGGSAVRAKPSEVTRVGWSFRAALLAGLIVGLINAAARATSFLSFGSLGGLDKLPLDTLGLGQISLGEAKVPVMLLIAMAGLWSGARASALALLFAHKILARLGRTSLLAYSLGGAAASLAYALVAALFWADATPFSIGMEVLSGLGAGFFYRLFAATERG
ncbi:MAG: hypothetical protein ACLQL2_01010 [Methylovirgula sp.]